MLHISTSDLFPSPGDDDSSLLRLETDLNAVDNRIADLSVALTNMKRPLPQVLTAIDELQTQRDGMARQMERLRQSAATTASKPLAEAKSVLRMFEQTTGTEQHNLRLKLRGLIANMVERVDLTPRKKKNRRIDCLVSVTFAGGGVSFTIDTEGWRNVKDDEALKQVARHNIREIKEALQTGDDQLLEDKHKVNRFVAVPTGSKRKNPTVG